MITIPLCWNGVNHWGFPNKPNESYLNLKTNSIQFLTDGKFWENIFETLFFFGQENYKQNIVRRKDSIFFKNMIWRRLRPTYIFQKMFDHKK